MIRQAPSPIAFDKNTGKFGTVRELIRDWKGDYPPMPRIDGLVHSASISAAKEDQRNRREHAKMRGRHG